MRVAAIATAGVLGVAVAAVVTFRPDRAAEVGAGVAAEVLCSAVFVSGRPAESARTEELGLLMGWAARLVRYQVDSAAKTVHARLGLLAHATARFTPGYGCRLQAPSDVPLPDGPPLDETAADVGFAPPTAVAPTDAGIAAALDRVFAERPGAAPKQVKAVVVVKNGRVVAERYAAGFGVRTRLRSYSVAKSFTNALVGVLVREGRLAVDQPLGAPEWPAGDPRAAIRIEDLMRMASGLDAAETGSGFDPVSRMLYLEPDMAGFAASRPLKAPTGTVFEYSSADTLLVDRRIGKVIGGGPTSVRAFAESELFRPLGMRGVTMEFDGRGVFIGSERVYATARDFARFGGLYLDDGIAPDGRRLLPEGWVAWSRRSTLGEPYGAGFWTLDGPSAFAARWVRQGFPKDGFFASGNLGQRIYIVPSRKLIVARFGFSSPPDFGIADDIALIAAAVHAN